MRYLLVLLFSAGAIAAASEGKPCDSLAGLALPSTNITTAQAVPAGPFTPPGEKEIANLPGFCRVAGIIKPSSDSEIAFEVWMPAPGWNGRFQGVGNGGFAGSISFAGLSTAVKHGYAAASTDTGHRGSGIDAAWALGHPEKVIDFGYRAIHEMTVKAKAITQAFYGRAPHHSYFASCSNGGRQALMEAQRYPADYDGIISGAPANDWTGIMAGFIWNARALSGPGYIPASKLPTIEKAVLAACDAKDGAPDGVLADPQRCPFDPASLKCSGPDSADCLTAAQAAALAKVYSGPRGPDGALIVPGFERGAETGPGGWSAWITGASPGTGLQSAFAEQFLRNMVFQDPKWDLAAFDLNRDLKMVIDRMGPILNATNPNLKAFRDHGGKLILFHGWNDAALPARNTVRYVDAVKKTMGAGAVNSFLRLYLVPGLQHCAGGPGATYCGGLGPAIGDSEHDYSTALEQWVEKGKAPGSMLAVRLANQRDPESAVVESRLLCAYPEAAVYKGSGDPKSPATYACKAP